MGFVSPGMGTRTDKQSPETRPLKIQWFRLVAGGTRLVTAAFRLSPAAFSLVGRWGFLKRNPYEPRICRLSGPARVAFGDGVRGVCAAANIDLQMRRGVRVRGYGCGINEDWSQ